jgi:hypothetical protein
MKNYNFISFPKDITLIDYPFDKTVFNYFRIDLHLPKIERNLIDTFGIESYDFEISCNTKFGFSLNNYSKAFTFKILGFGCSFIRQWSY